MTWRQRHQQDNDANLLLLSPTNEGQNKSFHLRHETLSQPPSYGRIFRKLHQPIFNTELRWSPSKESARLSQHSSQPCTKEEHAPQSHLADHLPRRKVPPPLAAMRGGSCASDGLDVIPHITVMAVEESPNSCHRSGCCHRSLSLPCLGHPNCVRDEPRQIIELPI